MRAAFLATAIVLALAPAVARERVEPIRFARGTSGAEVAGAVVRGERALYSLSVRAGQTLSARIDAPEGNAVFQVWRPGAVPRSEDGGLRVDGIALQGAGEGDDARTWRGRLPVGGEYLIVVGATRGNAAYRLNVTVH